MKFLGSKFALPVAAAAAVFALAGAQAMALSQTPSSEVTVLNNGTSQASDVASPQTDPTTTPIDIQSDGSSKLASGDEDLTDDAFEDGGDDSDDSFVSEDANEDQDDDSDESFEDENDEGDDD